MRGIAYLKEKSHSPLCVQIVLIIACCLLGALLQAGGFLSMAHLSQVFFFVCLFLAYAILLFFLKIRGRLSQEDTAVTMMILLGVLLRLSYVCLSGLYDRQHDAGAYTGMGTDFVNPGHIGYIEYIYKFRKLPDLNPYELFGYYHPPLHHILSCLWLQLNIFLGVAEDLAFENLQILTLLYSCLCMTVTWQILKLLRIKGTGLFISLAFFVFHPATIIMAGSVNNDMLTLLFMSLTLYLSLRFIREKSLKNLILLALSIGFGMITKLNSAVLAIPLAVIFLMHFLSVIRTKDQKTILLWIKNYAIFAVIVLPIGLSWIVRNLIRFREKPGVPVPGETSPMYTAPYSLWARLGIPSIESLHLDFPFHPISARACCNTWAIMMHTSLFAEEYPTDLPDMLLVLCQVVFFLALIFSVLTAVLLVIVCVNRRTQLEDRIYLLLGYGVMLLSFAAFVIIYPYTCSSDFRYVTICLVYISIAIGLGNKYFLQKADVPENDMYTTNAREKDACGADATAEDTNRKGSRFVALAPLLMHIINCGIVSILVLIQLIYLFWERW